MKTKIVCIFIMTLLIAIVIPSTGALIDIKTPMGIGGRADLEQGDAPEGDQAIAYPSLGVFGSFPTCECCGPALWIEHNNFGGYFGQGVDFEPAGNGGLCPYPAGFPPYDQDERFQDGDAGLMFPEPFTIDNSLNVVPFTGYTGTPLGAPGQTAVWGTDVDIWVHNTMPNHEPYVEGYVNILMDWNQNGIWNDDPSEHILINFLIPPLYIGPLSGLSPPNFGIGSNPGYVWTRFTITERPVSAGWMGDGGYEDGESEDYLLQIETPPTADLECEGSLVWTNVKPGNTVTGTFKVKNDGDLGSFLNWHVASSPSFGTWSYSPSSGTGLASGSFTTVTATCVAPASSDTFTGKVKVENSDDPSDFCEIDVDLTTPRGKISMNVLFMRLLEQYPYAFPMLRYILGL